MALSSECEVHDWSWDPSDEIGCPVCYGIDEEKKRSIELWKIEMDCECEEAMQHLKERIEADD